MRKIILLLSMALLILVSGCNKAKDSKSIYGYVQGDKYINKELGFSMDVPQGWIVNENFENLGEGTVEELGTKTVGGMVNMSMEEALSDTGEKEDLSSIYITLIGEYSSMEDYATEQYTDLNFKDMSNKKINGKDYIVIRYENSDRQEKCDRYVTMCDDKVLVFSVISSDDTIEEVDKSIESIKFK